MNFPECDVFEHGSRKWLICRNEAGLSNRKTDSYRVQWGIPPRFDISSDVAPEVEHPIPELIFHGHSVSEGHGVVKNKIYGPGSELLKIYEAAGVPSCDACKELAQQMNNWGVDECRKSLDSIVADILPRAKEWVAQQYPWVHRLLPNAIEEYAIVSRIKSDVLKAIDECERTVAERRSKRLNVLTGEKIVGCSTCGGGKKSDATRIAMQKAHPARGLVGRRIDREKLKSHIMYHVMPVTGECEWVWRRHIDWIHEVRPKFNGRVIIGIVTPGNGDQYSYAHPDEVIDSCKGLDAEFITAPNDVRGPARRGIGEGTLYPKMLEKLITSNPNEVAFYGHCKGVTRPGPIDSIPNLWAEAMFDTVFRNHDAAVEMLDTKGICGSFLMRGGRRVGLPGVGPHYFFSGTFFAMRLADVATRNWRHLPMHYGCVEQFPRLNFQIDTEAGCLFFDNVMNLYDETYWRSLVQPAVETWRRSNQCILNNSSFASV